MRFSRIDSRQQKSRNLRFGLKKNLAATYSRGAYRTTTIGKTVFDGRVRNGNGSDHSFMATKNHFVKNVEPQGIAELKAPDVPLCWL